MNVEMIPIQLNVLQILLNPHFYLAFFTRETGWSETRKHSAEPCWAARGDHNTLRWKVVPGLGEGHLRSYRPDWDQCAQQDAALLR